MTIFRSVVSGLALSCLVTSVPALAMELELRCHEERTGIRISVDSFMGNDGPIFVFRSPARVEFTSGFSALEIPTEKLNRSGSEMDRLDVTLDDGTKLRLTPTAGSRTSVGPYSSRFEATLELTVPSQLFAIQAAGVRCTLIGR